MDAPEYKQNCLAILNEMCGKFDLEAVFNLEKMTGDDSNREFVMNLSVWKFGFFCINFFSCKVNLCRLIAIFF